MANSRSARKRIRANERKHIRNRGVRSAVRTKVTKARRALLGIDETIDSQEQLVVAISALDRAAEKGVLHPNNAARRKSRLQLLANRMTAAATGGEEAQTAARAAAIGGEKGRVTRGGRGGAAAGAGRAAAAKSTGAKAGAKPAAAAKPAAKATAAKATAAKATAAKAAGKTASGGAKASTRGRASGGSGSGS